MTGKQTVELLLKMRDHANNKWVKDFRIINLKEGRKFGMNSLLTKTKKLVKIYIRKKYLYFVEGYSKMLI